MTTTIDKQRQSVMAGAVMAKTPDFVPKSDYPELEAAREAHEHALEEHRGVQARRQKAREEERQLQEHLASVQAGKREAQQAAERELKEAVIAALGVVGDHGEAWLEQIAQARSAALEARDALLAQAAELEAAAHKDDDVEAWIRQTMSSSVPQAFGSLAVAQPAQASVTA